MFRHVVIITVPYQLDAIGHLDMASAQVHASWGQWARRILLQAAWMHHDSEKLPFDWHQYTLFQDALGKYCSRAAELYREKIDLAASALHSRLGNELFEHEDEHVQHDTDFFDPESHVKWRTICA